MFLMPYGLPLELLAPGEYELDRGKFVYFDEHDLSRMAKAFNELQPRRKAPIVIGHPKDEASANVHAYVEDLHVMEKRLVAFVKEFETESFIAAIESKVYTRYQPSFWGPEHPDNPKPGAWILSHVGVLGPPLSPIRGPLVTDAQFMEYRHQEGEGRKLRPELRFGEAGCTEFLEFELLPTNALEMARRARACMEFHDAEGLYVSATQAVSFVTSLGRTAQFVERHDSGKPGDDDGIVSF